MLFEDIQDNIIENFANVYTELSHQVPLDNLNIKMATITPENLRIWEKEKKELGIQSLYYLTLEDNNEISGFTTMIYNPNRPEYVSQGFTGVRNAYRNRGIGKWLKATMLLYIKDHYANIQYVFVGNAHHNAPILAINEKIGFKVHREIVNVQLTIDQLKIYLNT